MRGIGLTFQEEAVKAEELRIHRRAALDSCLGSTAGPPGLDVTSEKEAPPSSALLRQRSLEFTEYFGASPF